LRQACLPLLTMLSRYFPLFFSSYFFPDIYLSSSLTKEFSPIIQVFSHTLSSHFYDIFLLRSQLFKYFYLSISPIKEFPPTFLSLITHFPSPFPQSCPPIYLIFSLSLPAIQVATPVHLFFPSILPIFPCYSNNFLPLLFSSLFPYVSLSFPRYPNNFPLSFLIFSLTFPNCPSIPTPTLLSLPFFLQFSLPSLQSGLYLSSFY
jgi:hypothetical protein